MKEKNKNQTFKLLKIIFIFLIIFSIPLIANCTWQDTSHYLPRISNPIGLLSGEGNRSMQEITRDVIMVLLGIVGSLALIMFIYGGFTWILSGGNEENVKKGKQTLKWSIAGMLIIFASYIILNFVLTALEYTPTASP